jgi:SAM-dependent methyltransferase
MSNSDCPINSSWNPVWETVFTNQTWGKYPSESLVQFIARNFYSVPQRSAVNILEVGCGPGPNLWFLAREGFSAFGIDGSAEAIRIAKKRLASKGLVVHLEIGDINNLPYNNKFFDAIVDVECLYANPRPAAENIMKEICRCLKPGGLFYSRTLTDRMCIGQSQTCCGHLEYTDISDGPIAGKGFARLMGRQEIDLLYGCSLKILSVDYLEYTQNNSTQVVSEWVIIGSKE